MFYGNLCLFLILSHDTHARENIVPAWRIRNP